VRPPAIASVSIRAKLVKKRVSGRASIGVQGWSHWELASELRLGMLQEPDSWSRHRLIELVHSATACNRFGFDPRISSEETCFGACAMVRDPLATRIRIEVRYTAGARFRVQVLLKGADKHCRRLQLV